MSFSSDAAEIRTKFSTGFAALRPTVPIVYDGMEYRADGKTPWVRLTILQGESYRLDATGPAVAFINTGMAVVQIFTPADTPGDGLALGIADDVATVLKEQKLTKVWLRTPTLSRLGLEGPWYQVNVKVPFSSRNVR